MNYDTIVSIKYLKESGEYIVKKRNAETGKTIKYICNMLAQREIEWTKNSKWFYDGKTCVWWAN